MSRTQCRRGCSWDIEVKHTLAKSSIGPTEARLTECSVCGELGSAVAEDWATDDVYCDGCIDAVMKTEAMMRITWAGMGVRHPHPSENAKWGDR